MRLQALKKNWYRIFVGALCLLQAIVFLTFREESYLQTHDNLDLFMAHLQMTKLSGAFFSQNATLPILHGTTRDLFGSEFSVYNLLYLIFPNFWAYLSGYALKIAIGMISFLLLAKEIYGGSYERYRPVAVLCAAAFGSIPVFPTYGIAFTSVPLIVWLLLRLYRADGLRDAAPYYVGIFCYPLLSYFSYHGFFILCYMVCAVLILWAKTKRFPKRIFLATCVLSIGFMTFEYRLFRAMLFDDTVTIRTTMQHGEITFSQAIRTALHEFFMPSLYNTESFHSADSHTYIALPVALIGVVVVNALYIKRGEAKKIRTEPLNGIVLWMLLNCLIYGLYQYAPFRTLLETLVPKLTGFEFARTAYFNTFLWYAATFLVCVKLYDATRTSLKTIANVVAAAALLVVMFAPQVYNDFYYTCYNQAYRTLKQKETSTLNYREFYSEALFDEIKDAIGYDGAWSAAYGMHPAVLQYNGVATVDGYLGMYAQSYKERWERVIAPALAGSPYIRSYFESWGARAYLYSGSDENTYAPLRVMELEDMRLCADVDALKELDCRYIFSRIAFSNADELKLELVGAFTNDDSPYTIYVYLIG